MHVVQKYNDRACPENQTHKPGVASLVPKPLCYTVNPNYLNYWAQPVACSIEAKVHD